MIKKIALFVLLIILFSINVYSQTDEEFYWEDEQSVSSPDSRFPVAANSPDANDDISAVFWQDIEQRKDNSGTIWISGQIYSKKTKKWKDLKKIAGPFSYSGDVPDIISTSVSKDKIIALAVVSGPGTILIYTFNEDGKKISTKELTKKQQGSKNYALVAPRLFTSRKGFTLFVTRSENERFIIEYSLSPDGKQWQDFKSFTPSAKMDNAFMPVLKATDQNDTVVFQGSDAEDRFRYQLYLTTSSDFGNTWTEAVELTNQSASPTDQRKEDFTNNRPNLLYYNKNLFLTWERTSYSTDILETKKTNAQIYFAELTSEGIIKNKMICLSENSLKQNSLAKALDPALFVYKGKMSVLWFDDRNGFDTVYLSQKNENDWNEIALSSTSAISTFAIPAVTDSGNDLNVFWQQNRSNGSGKITRLSSDRTVLPPVLKAYSYTEGKRSSQTKATVKITIPKDSSGIDGFTWIFTSDPDEEPEKNIDKLQTETTLSAKAEQDGVWYFKARVLDYAGNWSETASIKYELDTTPPSNPVIIYPQTDANGFVHSNTFDLNWLEPEDDIIAGYTYNLEYIGSAKKTDSENYALNQFPYLTQKDFSTGIKKPAAKILTLQTLLSYKNLDNGLYAFSVSAIDTVGNIGEPSTIKLFLNKYIPFTTITVANITPDKDGNPYLSIYGRGFKDEGDIDVVYLDKDGKAPFDITLTKYQGTYKIKSDRQIGNILVSEMDKGRYRIAVHHTKRGFYLSQVYVNIADYGTIRIGDYTYTFDPQYNFLERNKKHTIQLSQIIILLIMMFAFAGLVVSARGLALVAKDSLVIKKEVHALLTGEIMDKERSAMSAALKRRGVSLRTKLILFTAFLITMIIILVSLPLGYRMITTQEKTLSKGLYDRVQVLMDSLATGEKNSPKDEQVLQALPKQAAALPEANYATILGTSKGNVNTTHIDYVWGSTDKDILEKCETEKESYGNMRYKGENIRFILEDCNEAENAAAEFIKDDLKTYNEMIAEGISLIGKRDYESVERRKEISEQAQKKLNELDDKYTIISRQYSKSIPYYNTEKLDHFNTKYIFYKPVLFKVDNGEKPVQGVIITEISTKSLLSEVSKSTKEIIFWTLGIAILALAIGAILSIWLANIIVNPIKRLVRQVNRIARTPEKSKLLDDMIKVTSTDELGTLGESVNSMTLELIHQEGEDRTFLTPAKLTQRALIPLDNNPVTGDHLSVGHSKLNSSELFVYYEGAKFVSGDFFDCHQLDENHWAIIKCDISGKGANAAIIGTVVATLFKDYFKEFNLKKSGFNLSPLAYKINDAIEALNLKGKFAAYTLCIYDQKNSDFYFCNGGDNIIHYYDSHEKKKKQIVLQETPPAGPFPSMMIEMKSGYPVVKFHLNKGDILFLLTDGIEEAKRLYKDDNGNNIRYRPNSEEIVTDEDDKNAEDGEEMSPERVSDIIEAIMHQDSYTLFKKKTPVTDDKTPFTFNFTTCEQTPENVVMGLVSVEKVFRMYKTPYITDFDTMMVDKKIDAFLKEHFKQYKTYCANNAEHPIDTYSAEYLIYKSTLEDDQFDDLTLIALKI